MMTNPHVKPACGAGISKTGIARCHQPDCGCRHSSFVWVSHEKRIIWYEVPKAASSSIKSALGIHGARAKTNGGFTNEQLQPLQAARKYPDYTGFAIVRNPWDKMVSAWSMFCQLDDPFRNAQIEILFNRLPDQIPFKDFITLAAEIPNHHWEQCVRFLPVSENQEVQASVVGRFNQIEDFVDALHTATGLEMNLLRLNSTDSAHYSFYFDTDTIRHVADMFHEDIKIFGFSFGQKSETEDNASH